MAQNINVDVTPNLFQPTLYYHQGDIGRAFTITISTKDGYTIPSGATVKIEATKPSGLGFSVSGTLSGNVVSFVSTEGMTDEYGRFPAQLKITSGNDILYTANFLMVGAINTHPDSTVDGSQETVIPQLTLLVERVENAAAAVLDTTTEVTTLPAGSQATYSFDEETNTATFGIPQGEAGAGSAGVVANAYSASSTYAVGDYVIHNSNLYRCTTTITTAESFTSAHWTQVVLADDVTDLKSDISNTVSIVEARLTQSDWGGGWVNSTTGFVAGYDGTSICLSTGSFIEDAFSIKVNDGYRFYLLAYDLNGTYVGAWTGTSFAKGWDRAYLTQFDTIKYPNYKFNIQLMHSDGSAGVTASEYTNVVISYNLVNKIDLALSEFKKTAYNGVLKSKNLISGWKDDYVVSSATTPEGGEYPFDGGACSDFIPLQPYTDYVLDIRGESSTIAILGIVYDSNKSFINVFYESSLTMVETGIYLLNIKRNADIVYVRLNKHKSVKQFYLSTEEDYNKEEAENGEQYLTTDEMWERILATQNLAHNSVYYSLGDSITAGSYSTDEGTGVAVSDAEWAYGKQIAKDVGCEFHNLGVPGGTIINSVVAQSAQVGSDATLVTITGGANDYYGGDGSDLGTINDTTTSTVYGALKAIVNTIANTAPLARIVLVSPFPIAYSGSSVSTKWSRGYKAKKFTYDELNTCFKEVANFCNVEYIDGTTMGPVNIYNILNVQKDGVHPTIPFYSTIAQWLESKLF